MRNLARHLPIFLLLAGAAAAQAPAQSQPGQQPEMKINNLNVCTPSDADQQEMKAALDHVPAKPAFAPDFEVARGRTALPDVPPSSFVRMRRELKEGYFSTVQYTMIVDQSAILETLVFRVRDPKDILQLAIEDKVTGEMSAASVVSSNTPANRVKVERFGKSGLALARCAESDQSAYDTLFRSGSDVLALYRAALSVKTTVPGELGRLGVPGAGPKKDGAPKAKPAANKSPAAGEKPKP